MSSPTPHTLDWTIFFISCSSMCVARHYVTWPVLAVQHSPSEVAIVISGMVYVDGIASFGSSRSQQCVMGLELACIQNCIPKGLLVRPHDGWFSFS